MPGIYWCDNCCDYVRASLCAGQDIGYSSSSSASSSGDGSSSATRCPPASSSSGSSSSSSAWARDLWMRKDDLPDESKVFKYPATDGTPLCYVLNVSDSSGMPPRGATVLQAIGGPFYDDCGECKGTISSSTSSGSTSSSSSTGSSSSSWDAVYMEALPCFDYPAVSYVVGYDTSYYPVYTGVDGSGNPVWRSASADVAPCAKITRGDAGAGISTAFWVLTIFPIFASGCTRVRFTQPYGEGLPVSGGWTFHDELGTCGTVVTVGASVNVYEVWIKYQGPPVCVAGGTITEKFAGVCYTGNLCWDAGEWVGGFGNPPSGVQIVEVGWSSSVSGGSSVIVVDGFANCTECYSSSATSSSGGCVVANPCPGQASGSSSGVYVPVSSLSGIPQVWKIGTLCYSVSPGATAVLLPSDEDPVEPANDYPTCQVCVGGKLATLCPKQRNARAAPQVWVPNGPMSMPPTAASFVFRGWCYSIDPADADVPKPSSAEVVQAASGVTYDSCQTCRCHVPAGTLGVRAVFCGGWVDPPHPEATDMGLWVKMEDLLPRATYISRNFGCYLINPNDAPFPIPSSAVVTTYSEQFDTCAECRGDSSSSSSGSSSSGDGSSSSGDGSSSSGGDPDRIVCYAIWVASCENPDAAIIAFGCDTAANVQSLIDGAYYCPTGGATFGMWFWSSQFEQTYIATNELGDACEDECADFAFASNPGGPGAVLLCNGATC